MKYGRTKNSQIIHFARKNIADRIKEIFRVSGRCDLFYFSRHTKIESAGTIAQEQFQVVSVVPRIIKVSFKVDSVLGENRHLLILN